MERNVAAASLDK